MAEYTVACLEGRYCELETCDCSCHVDEDSPNAEFFETDLGTELFHLSMLYPMSPVYDKHYTKARKQREREGSE